MPDKMSGGKKLAAVFLFFLAVAAVFYTTLIALELFELFDISKNTEGGDWALVNCLFPALAISPFMLSWCFIMPYRGVTRPIKETATIAAINMLVYGLVVFFTLEVILGN